jgi:hypothetical protein
MRLSVILLADPLGDIVQKIKIEYEYLEFGSLQHIKLKMISALDPLRDERFRKTRLELVAIV